MGEDGGIIVPKCRDISATLVGPMAETYHPHTAKFIKQ